MKFASITATGSGNTEVVAAPTSGFIRVLGYQIHSRAAIDEVQLRSGASTVLARTDGVAAAGGGSVCPPTELGYCQCAALEALNVNLSATGNVSVNVQYAIFGN